VSKLKMTLLENSVSFFIESVKKAINAETATQDWKLAIFLLVQAIELILKEKLKNTHEILIYSNIDSPKHTVDLNSAINRLAKIDNIILTTADKETLESAAKIRNQIVHFEFEVPLEQIKSHYIILMGFYTSFCNSHLDFDVLAELTTGLHKKLLALSKYLDELETRARQRFKLEDISSASICQCPACQRETFNLENRKCYVCSIERWTYQCIYCSKLSIEDNWNVYIPFEEIPGKTNRFKNICPECEIHIHLGKSE